ncbi:MAG: hypothetical protein ABUS51_01025, partial [Acidobacteriota bacterium]
VISQAKAVAGRLEGDDARRIDEAYRLILQRTPTAGEKKLGLAFVGGHGGAAGQVWAEYTQVLLTSNEFQFLD